MGYHPHGVAEIDFGDVDTAVGADHQVNPQRPMVAGEDVGGQPRLDALASLTDGTGGLDHRSINKLCKALNCQPADLMAYVPDPEEEG